ncbi:MAG: hypothetical protein ACLQHK_02935 [Gallionellaceae bacterium]
MLTAVAVPTPHRPVLLLKALASIAAQAYTDWNPVVADNLDLRARKLADKLLLQHNNDSLPFH